MQGGTGGTPVLLKGKGWVEMFTRRDDWRALWITIRLVVDMYGSDVSVSDRARSLLTGVGVQLSGDIREVILEVLNDYKATRPEIIRGSANRDEAADKVDRYLIESEYYYGRANDHELDGGDVSARPRRNDPGADVASLLGDA